jgi:glycosyltransferase involved in cell wall biosynthesis
MNNRDNNIHHAMSPRLKQRAPDSQMPMKCEDNLELSVLVPVFNEAENLPLLAEKLVHALEKFSYSWEVLLTNDGSTDNSGKVLDEIAVRDARFKVVHLRRNFGQTAALMAALDHSCGNIIVMIDADLQNDPDDIAKMVSKLEEGYDVISGWRKERRDTEWGRRWPSRLANHLISRLSGVHLHDYGCTLKVYRRWTIENVRLYGEMHRYIPVYASWHGARVGEMPVIHHPRLHGKSKYGLSRTRRVLLDLLVIFFLDRAIDRPMQFFGTVGLYAFFAAFLAGLWALWLRFAEGTSFISTPLPLLFSLLVISGLLCLFFGVLAEMLMRTYFETRDQRAYLVGRTNNLDQQIKR